MRLKAPALLAVAAVVLMVCALLPTFAWATAQPWQMGQQAPATPIMERVHSFYNLLQWIIAAIVIFVFALIVYTCWRFWLRSPGLFWLVRLGNTLASKILKSS